VGAKFGYTSWHPSGKLAVYSIDNLPMFFHTVRNEIRDTVHVDSALVYYVAELKIVKTTPAISEKEYLETWPAWSADGRYLYFCRAKMIWTDKNKIPPDEYKEIKYDLVRIEYDVLQDKWGEVETVLSSKETGLSIAMPRVSPDGRWLMFCMCDYGYFPPWLQSSDLYIMDLKSAEQTGRFEYSELEFNSSESEAWHSWSSNSRWVVFSSKRRRGVFTESFIGYIDENGKMSKPFVLPQKDPTYYDYCLDTFNTPEFVTGPIMVTGEKVARVARSPAEETLYVPITMATPKFNSGQQKGQNWRE